MVSYVLSPAQYRQIKKTILRTILPDLVGRRLVPIDPDIGPGAQEASRTKLNEPDTPARIIPKAGRYGVITPTEEEVTVYIRKIGQAFVVSDEDLESSKVAGRPLDKRSIEVASRKVQEYEDHFIFNGYPKMNELGLIGSAGDTVACDDPWDIEDAEPLKDMNKAVMKVEKAKFKPNFAVFNNEDIGLLRNEDSYGRSYMEKCVKRLPIPESNYLTSTEVPKGTAMVMESSARVAELKQVEPIFIKPPLEQANDTQLIRIRERIGIDVYEPDAIVSLTGISS